MNTKSKILIAAGIFSFAMCDGMYDCWLNPSVTSAAGEHRIVEYRFKPEEDAAILKFVEQHGPGRWKDASELLPGRTAKNIRERYASYLAPELNRAPFTPEEDDLIVEKFQEMGSSWARMRAFFPGRTDVAIRNRYNNHLRGRQEQEAAQIPMKNAPDIVVLTDVRATDGVLLFPPAELLPDWNFSSLPPLLLRPANHGK
jgi:hypothetical protein